MQFPRSSRNWLTIIGAVTALINFFIIIILFIISKILGNDDTNMGLFIYIILPGFMILGLFMIPVGMIIERRKQKSEGDNRRLPWIDLNLPEHRNAFVLFAIITIIVLVLSTMGSFKAYHITESVEFCGLLCHKVMEPEHTAYQNSPHANVLCVECHVGAGTSWYVKSKLSGLHQIYAVITNNYSKPIETPLHDLRPARETCERCHWPEKFYARSIWTNKYFLADSLNTEWDVVLQMKTGPEFSGLGHTEGIHWHINPSVEIEYISENDKRETITYVKYLNKVTGDSIIYTDDQYPIDDSLLKSAATRTMDCIDCHNRPSHNYASPTVYVDKAMLTGEVYRDIPFIKKASMDILRENFKSKDTAMAKIEEAVAKFYKENYPVLYQDKADKINSSINAVKRAFSLNNFPRMKVVYDVYPDHIGHLESNGCFRCHNNSFNSPGGRIISKDCDLCHTILGQGKPGEMRYTGITQSLKFEHPIDIGTAWNDANCAECHTYLY
ncbi:MAG TPA: NapC/NirT family cytochrome c [Bacteroidales bacterium]|nr:NapC/NirT family cytochrome c [Bacteroidales bacterium]